jgi:isoaspartyl peptidase/L-asparaginase-like protein (Ntn-hydrolase superfamily)
VDRSSHPGDLDLRCAGMGAVLALDQSIEMDAFLMISAQRADSDFIMAANSSGLLPIGSAPSFSSLSRTTPVLMVSIVAFRILSAMFFGVPFGTAKPYQAVAS